MKRIIILVVLEKMLYSGVCEPLTAEALHWTLGVSFKENYLRTHQGNAAEIMSILRHSAYNMLQTYVNRANDQNEY